MMKQSIYLAFAWLRNLKTAATIAVFATGLAACSSGIVPNYDYYAGLTTEEITADFKIYSKDKQETSLSAPWMVELVGWLDEHEIVDNQAQKLSAEFNPDGDHLDLHAQLEYAYTVSAKKAFQPPEFDRARVNGGRLLLLAASAPEKDCDNTECTFSQKIILPLTVAEVVGSRYTGMTIQLIDPGQPEMDFRMPETYVRAFSDQVGKILEQNYTDFDRVVDDNARLNKEFGRDQLQVEDLAREWECDRTTVQAIAVDGPKSVFQVECDSDSYRLVVCQWGKCEADGPVQN